MIDEKMLIEKIKSIRLYFRGPRSGEKMVDEYLKHYRQAILDTIEKQPKIGEWIPVEERLPKEGEWVLCQCKANIKEVLRIEKNGDWYHDHNHCYLSSFVDAWMPLPKEYRKEDEE